MYKYETPSKRVVLVHYLNWNQLKTHCPKQTELLLLHVVPRLSIRHPIKTIHQQVSATRVNTFHLKRNVRPNKCLKLKKITIFGNRTICVGRAGVKNPHNSPCRTPTTTVYDFGVRRLRVKDLCSCLQLRANPGRINIGTIHLRVKLQSIRRIQLWYNNNSNNDDEMKSHKH